ncbi:DMT family transporter [Desulfopila aestuarii]|uniref:Permease of the drug/metabolite transporter (DMT) superfamily n=1 Tax=Desulfopila aestuarii DSM 18488 TaxID=1121416 RepID=A0A1M7Y429_9BACT|nr:DMT family transporter [Desulfopila aestuarii]SHO47020.1 Permease of the drug/metabolite transporter (DMT) superfamily [Desulfopila aestuarii DSM 18488]
MKHAANPNQPVNQLTSGAALFAVVLCMLFGANPVAVKICLTGIGAFTTGAIRFTVAATVLTCWAIFTGRKLAITSKQLVQMGVLGLFFFLQIGIFYFGQNMTTASHGVLISNIMPFLVMVMAHYLLPDDRINPRKVTGLIFGFSGIVLLFRDSLSLTQDALTGDLLLVSAVLIWSCNAIFVKRIIAGFTPLQITLYPMLISIPLFYLAGMLFDPQMVYNLSPEVLLGMFYQSIVTASFGFVMWNGLMQKYGATTLHAFVFVMPLSGVMLGVVILGEALTPSLVGSISMVAIGLVVINWRRRKSAGIHFNPLR